MSLIEAELAKAAKLVTEADALGIDRMAKLDELWELERQAAKMRHELQAVYQRIDKLLTAAKGTSPDE